MKPSTQCLFDRAWRIGWHRYWGLALAVNAGSLEPRAERRPIDALWIARMRWKRPVGAALADAYVIDGGKA